MTRLKVYYDGGCPVCSREIGLYRRKAEPGVIDWVDACIAGDEDLGPGLSRRDALARLHVRRADGSLTSGASAFAEIWRAVPGFRWLGRAVSLPPLLWLAERAYRLFLAARLAIRGG